MFFEDPDRLRAWAGVGLAWGGAMLSKYHAIFLPAGALLYILAEPSSRRVLRKPGPYLILPSHPAYMDPPNILRALWGAFRMRPMLLETNFESPILAPFAPQDRVRDEAAAIARVPATTTRVSSAWWPWGSEGSAAPRCGHGRSLQRRSRPPAT